MPRRRPHRPTTAGRHVLRAAAPAQRLWDVVRRIETGQRTLPEVRFVIDRTTGVDRFAVGYAWHESAHGRTDRFLVTRHDDRGERGGVYEVFVAPDDEQVTRSGTRVTVTPGPDGGASLRFDALLDPPGPLARLLVVLARPLGSWSARRAFHDTMRRIVATAEAEARGEREPA